MRGIHEGLGCGVATGRPYLPSRRQPVFRRLESALPHMHRGTQGEARKEKYSASNHGAAQQKRHNTARNKRDMVPRLDVTHCGLTLSWLGPRAFNAIIEPACIVILLRLETRCLDRKPHYPRRNLLKTTAAMTLGVV